jgi:hypothetical protein
MTLVIPGAPFLVTGRQPRPVVVPLTGRGCWMDARPACGSQRLSGVAGTHHAPPRRRSIPYAQADLSPDHRAGLTRVRASLAAYRWTGEQPTQIQEANPCGSGCDSALYRGLGQHLEVVSALKIHLIESVRWFTRNGCEKPPVRRPVSGVGPRSARPSASARCLPARAPAPPRGAGQPSRWRSAVPIVVCRADRRLRQDRVAAPA